MADARACILNGPTFLNVKTRNRLSLKRSGFPSWPPITTTVAKNVTTQASSSRLWLMVSLPRENGRRAPELDPGAPLNGVVDQKKNWTLTCELNGCCTAPPLP